MKKLSIALFLVILTVITSHASILVFSPNGSYTVKSTLADAATAADAAGKTVVVTSALSASFSNISSATLHAWPADRALKVEKGGSIGNTTTFRINSPFSAGSFQAFTGTGSIVFNTDVVNPNGWFSTGQTVTFNSGLIANPTLISSGMILGSTAKVEKIHSVWFGASTNTTLQSIIGYGETLGVPVDLGSNLFTFTGTAGITVDLGLTSLIGNRAQFDCTGMTSGYATHVYSSKVYATRWANQVGKFSGIRLYGHQDSGVHGLKYGHATNTDNNDLLIEDCEIEAFDRNVEFIDNAWRPLFRRVYNKNPLNYYMYYPSGLTNSGEVMQFDHCVFADGEGDMLLYGGQWDMIGCSLLNATMTIDGDARVTWTGGNMENPANTGTGYRYVHVKGADGLLVMNGGRIVFNNTGVAWTKAVFLNDSTTNGIIFNGVHFPSEITNYNPETDDTNPTWVAGAGRTVFNGGATYSNLSSNINLVLASGMNSVVNGDAEAGATTGWTATAYGSGGSTFAATAGSKRSGSYGFDITCVASGGINSIQSIPVRSGQLIIAQTYAKKVSGTGIVGYLQLVFKDAAGNTISNPGVELATTTDFAFYSLARIVPNGAVAVEVTINGQAIAGGNNFYIDDVIVNII